MRRCIDDRRRGKQEMVLNSVCEARPKMTNDYRIINERSVIRFLDGVTKSMLLLMFCRTVC